MMKKIRSKAVHKVGIIKKTKIIFFILIVLLMVTSATAFADVENEPHEPIIEELDLMVPPSRIIISDYFIEGEGLVAGEISAAVITLQNTSDYYYLNSILITGWIEPGAPVEFLTTNQEYAGRLPPGEEISVTIMYYTQNVDLTAVSSVEAGFTIHFGDEATQTERTNNVSINLPVLRGVITAIERADMVFETYTPSSIDILLSSRNMQAVYLGVLIASFLFSVIIILFKARVFVRK